MPEVTILIAARNAENTIERAIASVIQQGPYPIVLVDDFSSDNTSELARKAGGKQITVVQPPRHQSLGLTRQSGLNHIHTQYGMLLDADDELLPGRIQRMTAALEASGHEIFADALELCDGAHGKRIREISIPDFICKSPVPARLFERNYLPGAGQIGFLTSLAQQVGYDENLHGPEDIDLVLRMILAGARFQYSQTPGYRMYAYPDSVSRHLDRQREMYKRCLQKFDYEAIHRLYIEHGEDEETATWALVLIATYREEYSQALAFLNELRPLKEESSLNDQWKQAFQAGTLQLLNGEIEAATTALKRAFDIQETPETANNLAIALYFQSGKEQARELLAKAVELWPDYFDASHNLRSDKPSRITPVPLRKHLYRSEYMGDV